MSNIFESCTFYLSTVTNKTNISKTIKDAGGAVSFMLTKNVTHFICDDKEISGESFNWKKATSYGVFIVSESFVFDSVTQSTRLQESNFGFSHVKKVKAFSFFDSPAKTPSPPSPAKLVVSPTTPEFEEQVKQPSPTTTRHQPTTHTTIKKVPVTKVLPKASPPPYSSPPQQSSSFDYNSYSTPHIEPTTTTTSSPPPFDYNFTPSTFSLPFPLPSFSTPTTHPTIEIKKNPKKIEARLYAINHSAQPSFTPTFDVLLSNTLQFSNFSNQSSNNKFYHIELQKDRNGQHRVYTSYGRTDGPKTNECRYANNLDDAVDIYSCIYNEKTSDKKGYKPVLLEASSVSSNAGFASTSSGISADSELSPAQRQLVEHLYREATNQLTSSFSVTITERGIETPLGVLSMGQVEQGEKALDQIHQYLKNGGSSKVELERLSSEFFTLIPHKLGRGRNVVEEHTIRNLDQLNTKVELLQLMKDLLSVKVSGTGTHALDMKYRALKTELTLLSNYSSDYITFKNMTKSTPGVTITNVYQVKKQGDIDVYNLVPSPNKLLFHGSRASNFVGILSRGMLLPKVIVNNGGSRTDFGFLGAGIYYGDSFDTSCKYAHPSTTDNGVGKRYTLVSRVALGKTLNHTKINAKLTQPPAGYDSCLGVKKNATNNSDFNDNEYVIYNTQQQRQEFLIEFTYNGGGSGNSVLTPQSTLTPVPVPSSLSYLQPKAPPVETKKAVPKPATKQAVSTIPIQPLYSSLTTPTNYSTPIPPPLATISSISPTSLTSQQVITQELLTSFSNINNNSNIVVDYKDDEIELKYRKMFVSNRNDSTLSDKYLYCQKPLVNNGYNLNKSIINVNGPDCIMGFNATVKSFVTGQNEFESAWSKFTNNIFQGFNWNNVFVAGGSVLGCSLSSPNNEGFEKSDIDIFLYDLTTAEATRKLDEIETFIKSKSPNVQMARTKYAITFICGSPFRNIQIVTRIYKSPAEVLMGFDIDCCSIGYNGSDVYAIPRAIKSIETSCNVVSMSRRSLTYETRLFKYALRGFAIRVPKFNKTTVPSSVFSMDIKGSTGLIRLLLLEFKFVSSGKFVSYLLGDSDYSEVEIPGGQSWSVSCAVNFINYKEKSQFFAKKKQGFQHCHLIVVGDQAKQGKANWCKKCKNGEQPEQSTTRDVVVGPIQWITENPGQQILTGSFHPVDDNKWYDLSGTTSGNNNNNPGKNSITYYKHRIVNNLDVSDIPDFSPRIHVNLVGSKTLIDSSNLLCIAVGYGSNVSLKSMIHLYKQYVNVADEQGLYPIHYAAKSGNLECLELLLQNNSSALLRSAEGFSSGMISKFYNTTQAFERITRHAPRIWNFKCRIPSLKTLNRWTTISGVHTSPPPSFGSFHATSKTPENVPKAMFQAILDGNVEHFNYLIKEMNASTLKDILDPIGNSLFHYAVLSPLPEQFFSILKAKGLTTEKTASNIFGQSILIFAKATIGSINSWTRTHPSIQFQRLRFSSGYLHTQLSKIIKDLSSSGGNGAVCYVLSIPFDFISKYTKPDSTLPLTTNQQTVSSFGGFGQAPASSSFGAGFGYATPASSSFGTGFGSGFVQPPLPLTTATPSSFSFGSTQTPPPLPSSFGFGGKFPATKKSASPPLLSADFSSPSHSPLSSSFGSNSSLSDFTILGGGSAAQMVPQRFGSNLSKDQLSVALSTPPQFPIDLKSKEFLESSKFGQALALLDQFSANGAIPAYKVSKLKNLLFELHLPVFNCFEAYVLNNNFAALSDNLDLIFNRN